MDSAARTARARLAALVRHRGQDDPAVVQARTDFTEGRTRAQLRQLLGTQTPEDRERLLAGLDDDEVSA